MRRLYGYIALTAAAGLFSVIYELYSHGVYSDFMVYLFVIPLILGVLPEAIALIYPRWVTPDGWHRLLRDFAVATLSIGSILQGVVEIYGTTSTWTVYYFVVGAAMLLASIAGWIVHRRRVE